MTNRHPEPSLTDTSTMEPVFASHALDDAVRIIRQQQSMFHDQLMVRNHQLDENTQEIQELAQRGKSVVQKYREYMAEVHAMQSRVNRIAGDNAHMLKDVERGLAATSSLILPSAPLSSSTPHPHPRQLGERPRSTAPPQPPELPPSSTRPPMMGTTSPNEGRRTAPPPGSPYFEHYATEPVPTARDTPPHLPRSHTSQHRTYPGGSLPTDSSQRVGYNPGTPGARRASETLDGFNNRTEAEIRSAQRVATALEENVADAVERVHFAQSERKGQTGPPPAHPVAGSHRLSPITTTTGKPKAFRIPIAPSISRAFPSYPPTTHPYTDRDPIGPLSVVGRSHPATYEAGGQVVDTDGHWEVMLVQLCENIWFKTGTLAPPLPPGTKHPKIDAPGKYDGTNDHNILYNWLDGYLTWLRSYNVCGPDTDRVRVNCMRPYLTDKAVEWFVVCVDNPSLGYQPTFEETICAMHRRFIHSSSAARATLDFENCRYRAQDGLESFYAEIMRFASCMVEPPDNYTIRRKLMDGLPSEVYRILTLERNINAEESSVDEILTSARQVEQALVRIRHREYRERDHCDNAPVSGAAAARPESRGRDRSRDQERDRPTTVPKSNDATFKPVANRPATPAQSRTPNSCFGCGQVGHYTNDPVCPQFRKPRQGAPASRPQQRTRFHAQRVDMAGDDAARTGDTMGNPYEVDPWAGAGSQYDSEEERGLPPSEGGGSEVIRAQAMAMRITDVPSDEEDQIVLHMRAGRVTPPAKTFAHSTSVRRRDSTPDTVQPKRDRRLQASLCALINVNGIMAYTLFDSGSTTDSVSPEFVHVSGAKTVKLSEQVILQLGCSGSRSKISYGTWVPIQFGPVAETMYFDIVNLDRYDCVIGTPFMNTHGISLDFEQRAIVVKGQVCPAFTNEEDAAYRNRRLDSRKPNGAIRPSKPNLD